MSEQTVTVSLVVQDRLTKLELLDVVAAAAGMPIVEAGTARAHVRLGAGRAEVEVPKFGEDVQLAVDVSSSDPTDATRLLANLRERGLTVSVLGEHD